MADRFEECVTALLNGEVICHVSAPELFRFLDSDTSFNLGKTTTAEVVDEYLSKIGRGLAKTQDSQGYYCVRDLMSWMAEDPSGSCGVSQCS